DDYPDCNDFIYFTQSFSWPYEGLDFPILGRPQSVAISLDCEETVTGDFSSRDDYWRFFRVEIWLIDSSGDWINVFEKPSYWDNHSEIRPGGLQIERAWFGMIEDENGTQLDPTDTLTLAVGLSPTLTFEEWDSWNPWQNMTGTVTAHVTSVKLNVLGYFDVEIPGLVEPENTGVFNDGFDCYSEGICEGPGDTIYTVGRSSSYEDGRSALILQKWDYECNLLWSRDWNDTSRGASGYDIDVSADGSIFVTGVAWQHGSDLNSQLLMKWNSNGDLLWNRTYDDEHKGKGKIVAVSSDGNIYTLGERTWFDAKENVRYTPVLVKWDSIGNVLWSKNCSSSGFDFASGLTIASDGTIYCTTWEAILGFSPSGNVGFNLTEYADPEHYGVTIGPNDEIYVISRGFYNNSLLHLNPEGEMVKDTNFSRYRFEEFKTINLDVEPDVIRVLDNGSIYILCGVGEIGGHWTDSILYKYNSDFELVWTRFLSMVTWRLMSSTSVAKDSMIIGGNGKLYVTATNSSSDFWELGLLEFNLGKLNYVSNSPITFIVLGTGFVALVVIIAIVVRKQRSQ
ncbi:MAG: hypothetical protein ACTSSD_13460, partial [Candidatus Thorarchaeota archaeon]